ncbi:MAG: hypothetical protein Ta2B_20700 [Termitinemataceae bacterium]|nr:MAG: hypothetical protein Ta2B_20700 [Termitinemataceae bacterium]
MCIVELQNVVKSYLLGTVAVDALKGVSLQITKGDFVAVAGPSGSGKTTVMNIIGLIDKPSSGKVVIEGSETQTLSRKEITRMRQKVIGFVFQSFNLMPVLNVYENVELPLLLGKKSSRTHGSSGQKSIENKIQRKEWIDHLLESVGLQDRHRHLPSELSGGGSSSVSRLPALW